MLGLVKTIQMEPKIHILQALKKKKKNVNLTFKTHNYQPANNVELCSYREEPNRLRKVNFTKTNALKEPSRTKTYK